LAASTKSWIRDWVHCASSATVGLVGRQRCVSVSIGCAGSGDSGGEDDGEWIRVTETELEDSGGDANRLSRRIQLNLTLSSGDVVLTLERNDNVPSNVPIIIGQRGRLITSANADVNNRVGPSTDTRYACYTALRQRGCSTHCKQSVRPSVRPSVCPSLVPASIYVYVYIFVMV